MADAPITAAPTVSPVTAAATTPAAPPPAAPAVTTTPAAAPASDAAPIPAAPAAVAAPPASSPAAEQPTSTTAEPTPAAAATEPSSVLGETPKPPEPAAAEATPPATPEAPPAEPAPAPVYEFKWPEGVTPPPSEELQPFTGILGEAKVAPEVGQKLIDLYVAEQTKLTERLARQADETWNSTRREWVNQIKTDPDLGGNRFATSIGLAKEVLQRFGGSETQLAELRDVLNLTGAGDHPAVARLLYNVGRALAEGQPVAAARPVVAPTSRAQRRYSASIPTPNGAG